MKEVEKGFRLAIFNAIFHNRDDHGKNFTYLMNSQGEWKLSPAYDLTWSYGPGGEHSTTYLGEGKNPTSEHFFKLAKNIGVKKQKAQEIIEEVIQGKEFLIQEAKNMGVKSIISKLK